MKNYQRVTSGAAGVPQSAETDASTRQRVASSILEHGPSTAAELAERLGLTPAAIRRHLDVLLAAGQVEAREQRIYGARGRGRPAKDFVLTDAGRSMFYTAYDDIAIDALDFLATTAGPEAVTRFAEARMAQGEKRYRRADGKRRTRHHAGSGSRGRLVRGRLRRCHAAVGRSVNSSVNITARLRMWPSGSPRSARLKPPRSPACSVSTCSGSPPSRTAMVCARLMFPTSAARRPI